MRLRVIAAPKKVVEIECEKFEINTTGILICYSDARKTKIQNAFHKWLRFSVVNEKNEEKQLKK